MAIYGVAILATCALLGTLAGEAIGVALGVKANVGGIGIAMILLLLARWQLSKRGLLHRPVLLGVEFWAALYIPVVVAMASTQNVVAAVRGGPMVMVAAFGTVIVCLSGVPLLNRLAGPTETMDEIEAARASAGSPQAGEA